MRDAATSTSFNHFISGKESNMHKIIFAIVTAAFTLPIGRTAAFAQHGGEKDVTLHVNPRWSQCSFQLDPALTQDAWREFTEEAGLVAYFRPLRDATTVGVGHVEVSIVQWGSRIDDTKSAWNDTFVHPDSTHWLKEGGRLPIPGLTLRTGITDRVDVGAFWTKSFGANYGFWGAQMQYRFLQDEEKDWAASSRLTFVSLYGPDDLGLFVYGIDFLVSRRFRLDSDVLAVSPYAGFSGYSSNSHETSAVVDLRDEHVYNTQAMVGAVVHFYAVRLAAEYNVAKIQTLSVKVGVEF
jgi:hypothetical protein